MEIEEVITCIDCGGRAHLNSYPPTERDWLPGDLVSYRCEDCLDRWDLVVPGEDGDLDPEAEGPVEDFPH